MKNTIKNLYMDYKIYILDIENSTDLYKSILLYSYNDFKNIDISEINVSLESMLETFHEILDSQDSVTTLISNNELAFLGNIKNHPDYYKILNFVESKNKKLLSLTNDKLLDLGSIIPLLEY